MAGRRVLIVENDAVLRRSLAEQILAQEDFASIEEAADAEDGATLARSRRFDAMIVSAQMPGGGVVFARDLRDCGVIWPVLLLSGDACGDLSALGTADALAKPFRMGVLLNRLRALIRTFENSDDAVLTIGPYVFQPASKHLVDADDESRIIRLTEKEASILKFLYRAGATVTREVLLHEVWGYNPAVTTHTLETHVYRLRQKIEKDPSNATILVTDAGGYRLTP
jgi:DNA-binding response OmpR family regulator